MRARRSGLEQPIRTAHDHSIRQRLKRLIDEQDCRRIAAYWPFNGEPDVTPLFETLMASGRELALPVVSGGDDHAMHFRAWQPGTRLSPNRYGILEPIGAETVELAACDLLLMPLVAYDRLGNRLGMGLGYYDRHLAQLREAALPLRVGIAYSLQEVASLDSKRWDIPLHGLVNERGWFTFTNQVTRRLE